MRDIKAKEIGGYLEMEQFTGEEYYSDLYKLNLGRTAFILLLQNIEHSRVFIPRYICSSVVDSARNAGFNVVLYDIDEDLKPVWENADAPSDEDILYLVNYYGQLKEATILKYRNLSNNLIVDNAQAFFDRPVEGVHTLYSPRKFFGLCDGAYLATDIDIHIDALSPDSSLNRIKYLVGRMEESGAEHYSEMLAASRTFADEVPRRMSPFTQNMLKGINYEFVKKRRCDNYRILSELLPSDNPFTKSLPECPFAYPYMHKDGVSLRKYLADKKIFVPTNWSYLINVMPEDSLEYRWSSDILPLPIDQRYGECEMKIIADAVKAF